MPTFRDPNLMIQRRSPGSVPEWASITIGGACAVTFVAVTLGVQLVLELAPLADVGWLRWGPTFAVAFWMFASWLPPARLSRALRVGVLLPGAHAMVIALAWPAWTALSKHVVDRDEATELVTAFPIEVAVAATLAVFAAFAWLVARRRTGEWVHGFVMLALAELLLLGLWLPIACAAWPGGEAEWWSAHDPLLAEVGPRVAFSVIPPTVVALAFTAIALRRPAWLVVYRSLIVQLVAVMLLVAIATRLDASARVMVMYSNLIPILLAAAIVAIAALIAFGALIAWRAHASLIAFATRERLEGVIAVDGEEPAVGVEITSWLRGPRVVQRPFLVETARGTIPVNGAHLVAALSAETTQLRTGECVAVLRPGDRVTIAGARDASGDPFRTSAAPVANELFVAAAGPPRFGFTHVALAMWRPCVAYLLIVTAVALPALAALAAE